MLLVLAALAGCRTSGLEFFFSDVRSKPDLARNARADAFNDCRSDIAGIYYGDTRNFSKPASVDCIKVFRHISHFKLIMRRNMGEDNPRYWILIRRTNDVFRSAVQAIAEEKGYDLVGAPESVAAFEESARIPDVTGDVIAMVKSK